MIQHVIFNTKTKEITREDYTQEDLDANQARRDAMLAKYPNTIDKLKFKRHLVSLGQWESIRTFLLTDEDLWDEFLMSDNLVFGDTLTVAIAQDQGWTQDQLKQLFRDSR